MNNPYKINIEKIREEARRFDAPLLASFAIVMSTLPVFRRDVADVVWTKLAHHSQLGLTYDENDSEVFDKHWRMLVQLPSIKKVSDVWQDKKIVCESDILALVSDEEDDYTLYTSDIQESRFFTQKSQIDLVFGSLDIDDDFYMIFQGAVHIASVFFLNAGVIDRKQFDGYSVIAWIFAVLAHSISDIPNRRLLNLRKECKSKLSKSEVDHKLYQEYLRILEDNV